MVWEGTFNILVWCLPIATDFSGFSAGFFLSFSSGARGKILGGTILVSNTWKWVDLVNFTSYNPVSNYLKNNRSNRIFPGWIFRFHPRLDKIFWTLTVTDQVKLQSSSSCAALKMREIIISVVRNHTGTSPITLLRRQKSFGSFQIQNVCRSKYYDGNLENSKTWNNDEAYFNAGKS